MMAQEAVKLVTGIGEPLLGRVLVIDALRARQREIPLRAPAPGGGASRATDASREADVSGAPVASGAAASGEADASPQPAASTAASAPAPLRQFGAVAPAEPAQSDRTGARATSSTNEVDNAAAISWIDASGLRERLCRRAAGADRFTLLDVREPDEYASGAIPGSTLLPLGEVLRDPVGVGADDPLIVHCRTDQRAQRAALALARTGRPVTVVRGGYLAWADLARDALPSPAERRP
jgi:adenylyltransferase/sulfurtransferase